MSKKGDRGFESFSLQRVVCELSVTERQTISIQSDTRRRGHMTSVHRLLGRRHVRSIRHLRARLIVDACCHAGRGDLLSEPWRTAAPLGAYLRRARDAGIDALSCYRPRTRITESPTGN